jgi:hypothetical protein
MAMAITFWTSGEICEVMGKYGSRCCGENLERTFVAGDIFPRCRRCKRSLKWRRLFAGALPIDTIGTGSKSGLKRKSA